VPSEKTSLRTWHPYDWNQADSDFITKELRKSREELARLLHIGLDEQEARTLSPSQEELPQAASFERYMALRKRRSGYEMVYSIDLALDEFVGILVRFVADLANVNALASDPLIRRALQTISRQADITEDEIETWDPGVRRMLAEHYPGGREQFAPGKVRSDAVNAAARSALEELPKPNRGRPRGSANQAAHELARELSSFYERYGTRRAARSVTVNKSLDASRPNSQEVGSFREFFELAVGALPRPFRESVTRNGGDIAYLTRRAAARK
jgi:hypothetical protein